jgi:hypothetical protein
MHRKHTTAEDGMQSARSVSHSGKTLRWYLSFRPVAILAAAFAAILTSGLVAGTFAGVASAAVTPHALATSGLAYTALPTPVRIADTRAGATDPATYAGKTLAEGTGLTVDLPASANIPAAASAVVVNVTAVNPTAGGFLTVYPAGGTLPTAANVTFTTGQIVGNQVTVGLGTDAATSSTQAFTVYNGPATGGGSVDFTADVEGYYAPGTGSSYTPINPTRVYDSRTASGLPGAGTTLTAGGSDNVQVAGGTTGVPASATAVALNVAITNATASSFIDAYPTGATAPGTANQNFVAGETLSSQVVAGVGTGGDVTVANHAGSVDIIVDVDGYYTAGQNGSLLTVLATPLRLLDTRTGTTPGVAGGASATATLSGTGAVAGVLSIADIAGTTGNFLTAYATGATAPTAANVNYVPGDSYNVIENAAYTLASTSGSVSILNGPSNAGTANIVVDEDGFFTAPTSNLSVTPVPATVPAVVPTGAAVSSTVGVTVTHLGAVVNGDPLTLTAVGSPAGVCDNASLSTNAGDSTGAVSYFATAVPGTCTLTATDAEFGLTSTATITQEDNNSIVLAGTHTPDTGTALAASPLPESTGTTASTETLTATVDSVAGTVITTQEPINFLATALTPGGCGSLTPASGTTVAGVVTTAYTAPFGSGFCSVTATEAAAQTGESAAQVGTDVIDSTGGTAATGVTVVPSPTSVQTSGGTSTVVVTATGAGAGDPVLLTAVGTPAAACGTLSAGTGTTVAGGTATFTYTGSKTAGTCAITAVEGNAGKIGTGTITETTNNSVAVVATPSSVAPGGTSSITATVTSVAGTPVAGDLLGFTATPVVTGETCGSFAPTGGITSAAGQVTTTYTASAAASFCTITATEAAAQTGETAAQSGTTTLTQT